MPISWTSPSVQTEKTCAVPSSKSHVLHGLRLPPSLLPIPKRKPCVGASFAQADQGITFSILADSGANALPSLNGEILIGVMVHQDSVQDPDGLQLRSRGILRRCRTSSNAGLTADMKDRSWRPILKTSASGQFLTSAKNMKM